MKFLLSTYDPDVKHVPTITDTYSGDHKTYVSQPALYAALSLSLVLSISLSRCPWGNSNSAIAAWTENTRPRTTYQPFAVVKCAAVSLFLQIARVTD